MNTERGATNRRLLMLVMIVAAFIISIIAFTQNASAHASYEGKRFGIMKDSNGKEHYYVEFDVTYDEDLDLVNSDWTFSPSKIGGQELSILGPASAYGGKLRLGIPSIDIPIDETVVSFRNLPEASEFTATPCR